MTETMQNTATVYDEFAQNERVSGSVRAIVEELNAARDRISGVRGPTSPEARAGFEDFMKTAADVRGRPLLYEFTGSGLGNGPYVELADGSVKLDMITGIGVNFFGHSDPDLTETALLAATRDVVMQGHLMMNKEAIEFGEVLIAEASKNSGLKHAFLSNSGAMANENGLKVCFQKHAPACRVIAFEHCFMGRSTTMAQIGDSAAGRVGIPLNAMVDYMPFYDHLAAARMSAGDVSGPTRFIDMAVMHLEQYIARYPKQHACFVFELVQGEGGFRTALPEFHKALMEVCKANNIAVWSDEVQTFGRTEEMFCFDALGLGEHVDIACVGKMSQVCATLYTEKYNPKPGLLSGTFSGSTVGLRVGKRIMERLRDGGFYGRTGKIAKQHKNFLDHASALVEKHPEWFPKGTPVHSFADGFGGMMRFTPFGGEKSAVLNLCKALFNDGVIAFYCGHDPYHVRFLPPLGAFEDRHWDEVFAIVEKSMAQVAKG
ncbi:MAG: aminotransferase class III-fold pyridoxal phosphate-dependent enzyme [Phycisphaerales bacterium]